MNNNNKFQQEHLTTIAMNTLVFLLLTLTETISLFKLEIRSVERGICPIATSTMNELFL